jgi:hypothetical protein
MAKSIKFKVHVWHELLKSLKETYKTKPSVLSISYTMRRELGFTVRYHSFFDESNGQFEEVIYLDFFDDHLETLFRLKYAEYLNG